MTSKGQKGGKREGAGSPAADPANPKNAKVIGLRPSAELLVKIEEAARVAGLTNSAWLEQAAREKLERTSSPTEPG